MKKSILILISVCVGLLFADALNAEEVTLDHVRVKVFYSPDGGCRDAVIQEINNAKSEILVQAYSFTSKKRAKALARAFKRKVNAENLLIIPSGELAGLYRANWEEHKAHSEVYKR